MAVRITLPRSIVSPSLSFSCGKPYFGPPSALTHTLAVPVRSANSRQPDTRSAWMCVSRVWVMVSLCLRASST